MSNEIILKYIDVTKKFPGVLALDNVSFEVLKGEIHAIVGENGAGKSTLMKITSGLYQPDSGQIVLNGKPVQIKNAHQALGMGIAIVPQELNLVPDMSVAENIYLNIEPRNAIGMINRAELHRKSKEILATLGVIFNTQEKVTYLSVAEQQIIQIARALANQCKILILDEPTASLSIREKDALFERIKNLNQNGTTILYISHRMEEIFEISDRITVLRDGALTGTRVRTETDQNEIVRLMIGRALGDFLHRREKQAITIENVELELRNLSRKGLFQDITLQLHQGEILGIAGLVGARRTETFQSVFGYPPPDSGEVLVAGKTVRIKNPEEAIALGIGYLPEERKRQGIFPILSVLYNITIPFLKRLQKFTVMDQKAEKTEGARLSKQLRVQTPSIYKEVAHLSGGNQQKVILARWLGSGAKILILDEPTRGIDINAKAEIHELIYEMSRNGKSIVVISSETQELLAIADRILVMHEGRISGEVDPKTATEEDVLRLAMLGMAGTTA